MYIVRFLKGRSSCESLPSPASYSPHVQFTDPKCVFGRARRDIGHQNAVPGPASYEIRDLNSATPAFSLGIRFRSSSRSVGPGPTSYRIEQRSAPSPRWSFGYGKRWVESSESNPGPADYNTMPLYTKSPAFSLKSRHRDSQPESTVPGPGAYTDTLTQFEYFFWVLFSIHS